MGQLILVRYGELALKGKNRQSFEKRLIENIKSHLQHLEPDEKGESATPVQIKKAYGRIFVDVPHTFVEEAVGQLKKVFGIHSFSLVEACDFTIERMQEKVLDLVLKQGNEVRTFKIETRRPNKNFPIPSMEVSRQIGGYVQAHSPLTVDVHHPDIVISIEIRQEGVYLYAGDNPGPGGLPVGTSGKVLLMLSGGIDSPVAGWLAMKRGATLEAVHFHTYPFTSRQAQQKVEDLTQLLTAYGGNIRLHMVPFTEIQTAIGKHCPESLTITIMRRMMMRVCEQLAEKRQALAIVTGESLGQVASQTLESMKTINQVVRMPVLRPLITYDKQEIIHLARKIGTYETSILPYEDCCTLFTPKSPKTRPTVEAAARAESFLDVGDLILKAVQGTTSQVYSSDVKKSAFQYF